MSELREQIAELRAAAEDRIARTCGTHGTACRHHNVAVAPELVLELLDALAKSEAQIARHSPDPSVSVMATALAHTLAERDEARAERAEARAERAEAALDEIRQQVRPSDVYDDIRREREHQDRKWGGPEHDDDHRRADWYGFIASFNNHSLRSDIHPGTYREDMVRVAALAVAAIESHDRKAVVRPPQFGRDSNYPTIPDSSPVQSVWRPHPDGGLVTEVLDFREDCPACADGTCPEDSEEWRVVCLPDGKWVGQRYDESGEGETVGGDYTIRFAMASVWWWHQKPPIPMTAEACVRIAPPEWTTLPDGWEP